MYCMASISGKKKYLLTADLAWRQMPVTDGRAEILSVESMVDGHRLSRWLSEPGRSVFAESIAPKSFSEEPPAVQDFLAGVAIHRYPACLLREPKSKEEKTAFLDQLPLCSKSVQDPGVSPPAPKMEKEDALHLVSGQSSECCSELLAEISGTAKALLSLLDRTPQLLEDRLGKLAVLDGTLLDLQHLVEFSTLAVPDAYRVYQAMREARLARRQVKDELEVLALLQKFAAEDAVQKIVKKFRNMDTRRYLVRAMTEEDVRNIIRSSKVRRELGLAE